MAEAILKLCFVFYLLNCVLSVEDRYYPRYHLAPPFGWMNDPNGFCVFNDEYHLFYQYNPESSLEPGIAHWGHAKSKDLFNWDHLPIALFPDQDYDVTGVFSGSALVEGGKMYLFYTGNVNHPGQSPDHEQHQNLAISSDGETFTKYDNNPIIEGAEHQPNFRDPKVWKHNDTYYMVLGNSLHNDSEGRALLYASKDKITWNEVAGLEEYIDGNLGYMWECPDFFELDGRFILLFSPQGIKPEGEKYKNLYQTGYIVGSFDYNNNKFMPLSKFRELDHGHDFYATQTILDNDNRRLMVAWFDMWEQNYPEQKDGFTGFMTIPRELSLSSDNRLIQKPVQEFTRARGQLLHSGKANMGTEVVLTDKAGQVNIITKKLEDFEFIIESNNKVVIRYDYARGTVTLDRGGNDGVRTTQWRPKNPFSFAKFTIFIDASSVELFCGDGEVTFSSRFFPDGPIKVRVGEKSDLDEMSVYDMQRTILKPY